MKTAFIKILVTKCISEIFILDIEIMMPNSALHYENVPALASALEGILWALIYITANLVLS